MQDTLGTAIKRAREERRTSREKLSQETGVSLALLTAFEDDEFGHISEAYALAYLKKIASFLGLDRSRIFSLYHEVEKGQKTDRVVVSEKTFYISRDVWVNALIVIVVLGFLGYQAYNFFRPPFLVITQPSDDFVSNEGRVDVRGRTEQGVRVVINGEDVEKDENEFSYSYFLTPGVNTLDIVAERRFGGQLRIRKTVMYNP